MRPPRPALWSVGPYLEDQPVVVRDLDDSVLSTAKFTF